MITNEELDSLLDAYCEGLYAMDPRTTFPFWDYDFAPLYSRPWIDKISFACDIASHQGFLPEDYQKIFNGPSVPRKELIYSLVDMKVAKLEIDKRMFLVNYWADILRNLCGEDWLSNGSNRSFGIDNPDHIVNMPTWTKCDAYLGRTIGGLTAALNALSYSLYSDVFVHQCAECRGPYDVSKHFGKKPYVLLVRVWNGLRPMELWKDFEGPEFETVKLAVIYENLDFHIDVYNHVSWDGIAPKQMRLCYLLVNGEPFPITIPNLNNLINTIITIADGQYKIYHGMSFEDQKILWIHQRNYQFREFFGKLDLSWKDTSMMEKAVRGKPLFKDPFWDMSLPKKQLFAFLRKCLDPREDYYYNDWHRDFLETFGEPNDRT